MPWKIIQQLIVSAHNNTKKQCLNLSGVIIICMLTLVYITTKQSSRLTTEFGLQLKTNYIHKTCIDTVHLRLSHFHHCHAHNQKGDRIIHSIEAAVSYHGLQSWGPIVWVFMPVLHTDMQREKKKYLPVSEPPICHDNPSLSISKWDSN